MLVNAAWTLANLRIEGKVRQQVEATVTEAVREATEALDLKLNHMIDELTADARGYIEANFTDQRTCGDRHGESCRRLDRLERQVDQLDGGSAR